MKVCKFGGSSLSTAEMIRKVCHIVESDQARRIVVVSAPGRRSAGDSKVTDLLIRCAEAVLAGESAARELAEIVSRYRSIAEELGLDARLTARIEQDFQGRLSSDRSHRERFVDCVKAGGEDNCAILVAEALRARGNSAEYVSPAEAGLLVSSEYGNARILPESYNNLRKLRGRRGIVVMPGFFGNTRTGDVVTFPRGGSDITGAVVAAAVGAELYENFTDVDSVFSADPDIIPDAAPIRELTYREMRELSYAGFEVLHEEAIIPLARAGIPIWIRNTNSLDAPGTRIVPQGARHGKVVGIAAKTGFCTVYVSKYLMNREIGFGRRLLSIFEDEALAFEHMPSGIDNISVILRESDLDEKTAERIVSRIRGELNVDDVCVERGLALVMITGEGMRCTVGIAARATRALAEAGVNIEMLNQGASEISMMFGVKASDCRRAVAALHRAFFAGGCE